MKTTYRIVKLSDHCFIIEFKFLFFFWKNRNIAEAYAFESEAQDKINNLLKQHRVVKIESYYSIERKNFFGFWYNISFEWFPNMFNSEQEAWNWLKKVKGEN